jgi:hypothetical protein
MTACIFARIGNYPYDKDENTDDIVRTVASRAGVVIEPQEIDVSHRTGKAKDDRPREIIVKFCSVKSKSKFMKCRKLLREKKLDIYIGEDLTEYRNELFFQCRMLKKNPDSDIEKTWTYNGNIFVKVKDIVDPIKIQNSGDLSKYVPVAID